MASKDPQIRAIELETDRLIAERGIPDTLENNWNIRAGLREQAGLPPEKRKRGGVAGAYDRNKKWVAPVAAGVAGLLTGGLAAPLAIGALEGFDRPGKGGIGYDVGRGLAGAAKGGAAGAVGNFAGGFLPGAGGAAGGAGAATGGLAPIPAAGNIANANFVAGGAAGAGGGGFSLGGLASQAGNWLKDPKNLMKLGSGIHGITQQQKGAGQMNQALADDRARWAAGAPLREQGRAQMLAPMPIDTSSLDALAGQGNPFAKKRPPVAIPPMPAGGR